MATLKRKSFERDTGLTDDQSYLEYHKQSKPWLYSNTLEISNIIFNMKKQILSEEFLRMQKLQILKKF